MSVPSFNRHIQPIPVELSKSISRARRSIVLLMLPRHSVPHQWQSLQNFKLIRKPCPPQDSLSLTSRRQSRYSITNPPLWVFSLTKNSRRRSPFSDFPAKKTLFFPADSIIEELKTMITIGTHLFSDNLNDISPPIESPPVAETQPYTIPQNRISHANDTDTTLEVLTIGQSSPPSMATSFNLLRETCDTGITHPMTNASSALAEAKSAKA